MAEGLIRTLGEPLRQAIRREVIRLFNDRARGEAPVTRRADGLFGPQAVAWRVHGDVAAMMAGGIASLLMQMLMPRVLAGVWDHFTFRQDMHGRLRRTARFIALTTYGSRAEAESVIARVRAIHDHVRGTLPDGTPYAANDPAALAWVHANEATSFLDAYIRYVEPGMPPADQDRYFAEVAVVAEMLGARSVPRTRAAMRVYIAAQRPGLRADARTREVARLVLTAGSGNAGMRQAGTLIGQAAIDLLPDWARGMHGLPSHAFARPAVRAATAGLSGAIRWALR